MSTTSIKGTIHLKGTVIPPKKILVREGRSSAYASDHAQVAERKPVVPRIVPWTRPEKIDKLATHVGEDGELPARQIGHGSGLFGSQMKVIYDLGPGRCSLAVADVPDGDGPCILIRRNGRDDDHPEGFPANHWHWQALSSRPNWSARAILAKYALDKEARRSVYRYLIWRRSWDDSGLGGLQIAVMNAKMRRDELRLDRREDSDVYETDFVSWDRDVSEEAFNDGQVVGEDLEEREADDLEPGDFETDEPDKPCDD